MRALLLFLLLPFAAAAQDFPERLDPYVNDFASVLSAEEESSLHDALVAIETETGVQAVVVTVRARSDYGPPLTVEEWSTSLFNTWEIGDASRNDGIMIMAGIEDREMWLVLGSGYPPEFDAAAQRVVDNAIIPSFREQAYGQGLLAGVKALRPRLIDPHQAGNPPPAESAAPESGIIGAAIFGAIGFLIVIGANSHRRVGNFLMRFRRCPSCGAKTLQRSYAVLTPASIYNEGKERQLVVCNSCSHRSERDIRIPKKGRKSRSGGSSGSGGGRSSGGGAGGRW